MTVCRKQKLCRETGTILILALWTLGILSVFAIYLAVGVRQKITLHSRLEQRSQLSALAESGIRKAIVLLNNDIAFYRNYFTAGAKKNRHNNKEEFKDIQLGEGSFSVSYGYFDFGDSALHIRYGIQDEESKLNINHKDISILKNLFRSIFRWNESEARDLAEAIKDWQQYGQSSVAGFFSDEYYGNLVFPYPEKDASFERMDELLLIKGMTKEIFEKLTPYITVYGEGRININTAPKEVLMAIGLAEELVDKVLRVRRGADGVEATEDDFVFLKPHLILDELNNRVKLKEREIAQITMNMRRKMFATQSVFYTIHSEASLPNEQERKVIACVFDTVRSRIVYWSER